MSSHKSATSDVRFEPVLAPKYRAPGLCVLALGAIYPAAVIAVELATRMCAESLFDPMPSPGHALVIGLVPASNLMLWLRMRTNAAIVPAWLLFGNGVAIAVAGFYALLFLPLMPVAIPAIAIGIGLLPLAPLAAVACAIGLNVGIRRRYGRHRGKWPWRAGAAAGLVLLLALDIPAAATRLGVQWAASEVASERERGLTLLRLLGDDDLLLRLCYDVVGRPTGVLSALVLFGGNALLEPRQNQLVRSPEVAREIYYRVHGLPFNIKPVPFDKGRWSRFADIQSDGDHGAAHVGGRVKGLEIASSRIDGSVSGGDAVAYLEWTIELRNSSLFDREARLQLALPPGGVVSRATLWVNGEEREAAVAGRGEVRAAYRRVAVVQRRDPLLVTTKGADRVLAQAFPVPRNGGILKFKIGITAPLELETTSVARLTLPAVIDRNFTFPAGTSHSVWIESKQSLASSVPGLAVSRVDGRGFRIGGSIDEGQLSSVRVTIAVDRDPDRRVVTSRLGDGELIVQEVVSEEPPSAAPLMLVIDGSARLKTVVPQLVTALEGIPPATPVGAIVAGEPVRQVPIAAWSRAQHEAIAGLLRSTRFVGGQDNAPALAEAIEALEAMPQAQLLWIGAPQPVSFPASAARLEQSTLRLARLPELTLYSVEAGPNELLPDLPWAWRARSLPRTGSAEADLSVFLGRITGKAPMPSLRRSQRQGADGLPTGSDHLARLWASQRVLDLMQTDPVANRDAAVTLSARYRLVTPVSGAVVLETTAQYAQAGLTPASAATVPTVPEPEVWAMMVVALAALAWLAWRRQATVVA